ncbi:MAG: YdeI/OmpD-associated family protein [Balneola sp.]|nr:YdeI/OmpD-associated family protein [Balneola sp.]MBO6649870.1 YdeI/OmpD-associated family protein [Balneola sp.]MBO6712434.1 YdeI/OmpD-associated family protein [Balneola sp.]MBO6801415.1 YdeI/OmpD-associated family protein [Balneola sp.]MBO6871771.1 YdeI/OmpD-associated family protein [Balneola sp.]
MKTFHLKTSVVLLDKPKMNIVVIPKAMVEELGGLGTRLLCSVNEFEEFHCGMVAYGEGQGYISLNKKRLKIFGANLGDEVSLELRHDQSKYGMEMPEELEALLEQDGDGARLFEALSDGKKRYIIHYVDSVKSSQLKIDRAIMLINNLKTMGGKFDFRHLLGMPPRDD